MKTLFWVKMLLLSIFSCLPSGHTKEDDVILNYYKTSYRDESFFTEKSNDENHFDRKDRPWYALLKLCNGHWISKNYEEDGFKIVIANNRDITLHCTKKWKEHDKLKILIGPTFDFYVGNSLCSLRPEVENNQFQFGFIKNDVVNGKTVEDGCILIKEK